MEWEAKKVGIVIPTYDNLPMLKRLIYQVARYTPFFELIIIEDGQIREAIEYLRVLHNKFSNIHCIFHTENKGVSPSWNDGLRKATELGCDYFAVFNDDIEIYPGWWTEVNAMFKLDYNLVSTRCPKIGHEVLGGWFFIFDRKTLDGVGYFDENIAPFYQEDTDFVYRFQQTNLKSVLLSNPLLLHHESTTIKKNIKVNKPEFYAETIERIGKYLKAKWKT